MLIELYVFSPFIILFIGALGCMLWKLWSEDSVEIIFFTCFILLLTAVALLSGVEGEAGSLLLDSPAKMAFLLIIVVQLIGLLYSYIYLRSHLLPAVVYCFLYLLLTAGSGLMVSTTNLLTFYLGLELTVFAGCFLAFYDCDFTRFKLSRNYFFINLLGSLFFLVSFLLMFVGYRTVDLAQIDSRLLAEQPGLLLGVLLAIAFKGGLGPFYFLFRDFYNSAPTPLTFSFFAAVRTALLIFFLRVVQLFSPADSVVWLCFLVGFGFILLFFPVLQAFVQNSLKESAIGIFLASGGIFLFLLASGDSSVTPLFFYLLQVQLLLFAGLSGVILIIDSSAKTMYKINRSVDNQSGSASWLLWQGIFLAFIGVPPLGSFIALYLIILRFARSGMLILLLLLAPAYLLLTVTVLKVARRYLMKFQSAYSAVWFDNNIAKRLLCLVVWFSLTALLMMGFFPELFLNFPLFS